MYPENDTLNAKISHTTLGFEDHGFLIWSIGTESEKSSQSFGSIICGEYNKKLGYSVGTKYMADCVAHILHTVGVDTWEELKGQHIRIKREGGRIAAIGNFMEDRWFRVEFPNGEISLTRDCSIKDVGAAKNGKP